MGSSLILYNQQDELRILLRVLITYSAIIFRMKLFLGTYYSPCLNIYLNLYLLKERKLIKVMNILQRDYSSFTNESFRDDISIQKWNYSYNNVQDLFNDFYV